MVLTIREKYKLEDLFFDYQKNIFILQYNNDKIGNKLGIIEAKKWGV